MKSYWKLLGVKFVDPVIMKFESSILRLSALEVGECKHIRGELHMTHVGKEAGRHSGIHSPHLETTKSNPLYHHSVE